MCATSRVEKILKGMQHKSRSTKSNGARCSVHSYDYNRENQAMFFECNDSIKGDCIGRNFHVHPHPHPLLRVHKIPDNAGTNIRLYSTANLSAVKSLFICSFHFHDKDPGELNNALEHPYFV